MHQKRPQRPAKTMCHGAAQLLHAVHRGVFIPVIRHLRAQARAVLCRACCPCPRWSTAGGWRTCALCAHCAASSRAHLPRGPDHRLASRVGGWRGGRGRRQQARGGYSTKQQTCEGLVVERPVCTWPKWLHRVSHGVWPLSALAVCGPITPLRQPSYVLVWVGLTTQIRRSKLFRGAKP